MELATVIVAGLAAFAALLSVAISLREGAKTRGAVDRRRDEDRQIRQLNELYGPIYVLRRESRQLWKQLHEGGGEWRLLDKIEEIQAEQDPRRRAVIERILEMNGAIHQLIVGKAGLLVSFPPPDSFATFLEHSSTLQQHWERGANVTDLGSYVSFPRQLDDDLNRHISKITFS